MMSTTDTTYEALIAKLLETSGARVFRSIEAITMDFVPNLN